MHERIFSLYQVFHQIDLVKLIDISYLMCKPQDVEGHRFVTGDTLNIVIVMAVNNNRSKL